MLFKTIAALISRSPDLRNVLERKTSLKLWLTFSHCDCFLLVNNIACLSLPTPVLPQFAQLRCAQARQSHWIFVYETYFDIFLPLAFSSSSAYNASMRVMVCEHHMLLGSLPNNRASFVAIQIALAKIATADSSMVSDSRPIFYRLSALNCPMALAYINRSFSC